MIDERQELPKFVIHLIWFAFGFGGLFLTINDNDDIGVTTSIYVLACTIFSAFATYGLINFINDIKEGKNWKGVWWEIKNNINKALK